MNGNVQTYCSQHIVAIPYPGRGHINPMMNLCKLLVTKYPNLTVSFVVTEEWLALLSSTPKPPPAISFQSIPNVIPSELIRGSILTEFLKAVYTKMEAPVEQLLRLDLHPIAAIIADTYLPWTVALGNRKNIPVVSLWTQSPTVFSLYYHFDLVIQNGHLPANLSERGDEVIDYIPGMSSTRLVDLPGIFSELGKILMGASLEAFSFIKKTHCVMLTSFDELECQAMDILKATLPFPVYSVGPLIPHEALNSTPNSSMAAAMGDYFKWLDSQPAESVLYISLGSFLSVSKEQMTEIVQGVRESGVRFLWVVRGDTSQVEQVCGGMGLVVPWCDQLKVLCHSSIGGFWTHCGWNSTLEGVFAGVPMLTFPINFDQIHNGKLIADEWGIGMRVKDVATGNVMGRKAISMTVQRFMNLDGDESKEMRRKGSLLKQTCKQALSKGGSSEANLDAFARHILRAH